MGSVRAFVAMARYANQALVQANKAGDWKGYATALAQRDGAMNSARMLGISQKAVARGTTGDPQSLLRAHKAGRSTSTPFTSSPPPLMGAVRAPAPRGSNLSAISERAVANGTTGNPQALLNARNSGRSASTPFATKGSDGFATGAAYALSKGAIPRAATANGSSAAAKNASASSDTFQRTRTSKTGKKITETVHKRGRAG